MYTARRKIVKEKGVQPNDFEQTVGQALFDLEVKGDLPELKELHISGAREIDLGAGKSAVVIFVPYPQLTRFHKIQTRLIRELEKKFHGKQVVIIANRRILPPTTKKNRQKRQQRPRSRTLTAVHDAILEDMVYPTEIVGKRLRVRLDGSRQIKVYLDPKDHQYLEYKTETFSKVYKKLTGKTVLFEFPSGVEATVLAVLVELVVCQEVCQAVCQAVASRVLVVPEDLVDLAEMMVQLLRRLTKRLAYLLHDNDHLFASSVIMID